MVPFSVATVDRLEAQGISSPAGQTGTDLPRSVDQSRGRELLCAATPGGDPVSPISQPRVRIRSSRRNSACRATPITGAFISCRGCHAELAQINFSLARRS